MAVMQADWMLVDNAAVMSIWGGWSGIAFPPGRALTREWSHLNLLSEQTTYIKYFKCEIFHAGS